MVDRNLFFCIYFHSQTFYIFKLICYLKKIQLNITYGYPTNFNLDESSQ